MTSRHKVLLVYPRPLKDKEPDQWVPLALLGLAGPLEQGGYEVVILDEKMEPGFDAKLIDQGRDALCVGISSITGRQIANGIRVAQRIRQHYPKTPIVWGGWHPTVEPETTAQSEWVDVVVRGQGELTMREVADRLAAGQSMRGCLGTTYVEDGELVHNPDRPLVSPNDLPRLAYHLVDVTKYRDSPPIGASSAPVSELTGREVRGVSYITSRGCPFRCRFCCVQHAFHHRWLALDVERVLSDLEYLTTEYNVNTIFFEDNEFCVRPTRLRAICQGIVDRGIDIAWWSSARAPQIFGFPMDLIELLRASGCFQLFIGAESGSQRMLDLIDKKATVEDTLRAVERLWSVGIIPHLSYIVGLPTETEEEMWQTVTQIGEVKTICERARTHIGSYTPYPGSPLYPLALKEGLIPPTTLEGWAMFKHGLVSLSNLSQDQFIRLRIFANFYMPLVYPAKTMQWRMAHGKGRWILRPLAAFARWRHRHRKTGFMWELPLLRMLTRVRTFFKRQ